MEKKFSIGEALSHGWQMYKKNVGLFLIVMLTLGALQVFGAIFGYQVDPQTGQSHGYVSVSVLLWLVGIVTSIGLIVIALSVIDKEKANFSALFTSCKALKKFFFFIVVNILYFLIVFGGLLLLIVPGIIWALKYQFCTYFIVDKNLGPIEGLTASGKITRGHKWDLLGFNIVAVFVNVLGVLALGIGLLVTLPVTLLAYAFIFRKLCGQGGEKQGEKADATAKAEKEEVLAPVMTAEKS